MKYMENGHARWSFMNLLERLCIAPSFIKNRKHLRPFFLEGGSGVYFNSGV